MVNAPSVFVADPRLSIFPAVSAPAIARRILSVNYHNAGMEFHFYPDRIRCFVVLRSAKLRDIMSKPRRTEEAPIMERVPDEVLRKKAMAVLRKAYELSGVTSEKPKRQRVQNESSVIGKVIRPVLVKEHSITGRIVSLKDGRKGRSIEFVVDILCDDGALRRLRDEKARIAFFNSDVKVSDVVTVTPLFDANQSEPEMNASDVNGTIRKPIGFLVTKKESCDEQAYVDRQSGQQA